MIRRSSISFLALSLMACGGADVKEATGPDPCVVAKKQLRRKLGPELANVALTKKLPMPPPHAGGCALVYTQMLEELPEELDGESVDASIDQRFAISLPDNAGRPQIELLPSPGVDAGPVLLSVELRDLTGDNVPDVVVQEDAGIPGESYRALRIYSYTPGQPNPQRAFAERLVVKTPEGLEIIPTWQVGQVNGTRALLFDGAGTKKVFMWNEGGKRFQLDAAATASANPKPKAPEPAAEAEAVPATAAPAVVEAPPKVDEPKAEEKKKPAPKKKKAAKKAPAKKPAKGDADKGEEAKDLLKALDL